MFTQEELRALDAVLPPLIHDETLNPGDNEVLSLFLSESLAGRS